MEKTFIGLDFGSDSVRALLVSASGEEIADAVCPYPRWQRGLYCDPSIAQYRQHPLDYLEAMEQVLREVLRHADPRSLAGIGVDTTGSTPCAVDAAGVPLALTPDFAEDPDAMFLLWKDHTAYPEAEEINAAARRAPIDYTRYEGGIYSAEWFWSKYLHILRHDERLRPACAGFVEHCDWITAELTGGPVKPSRCAAGHKAMWHPDWHGLPPDEFLTGIDPLLAGRRDQLYTETFTADTPAGTLSEKWAAKLGVSKDVVVAVGLFDCHAGAVGAGIRPGVLVKIIGTSTCDILVAPKPPFCVRGICGQVDGSVIPSLTGFEAGQSAFGDIYAWFRRFLGYAGDVPLAKLEEDARKTLPKDVFALDWMNGRRTPDADASLQGAIFGLTLGTTAPEVYRALVESTAFGARRINDRFREGGLEIREIRAAGGIAGKSPLVMQTCADVLDMPIAQVRSEQTCALGAAIFAAAASGVPFAEAMRNMASGTGSVYRPDPANRARCEALYRRYLDLAESVEKEHKSHVR